MKRKFLENYILDNKIDVLLIDNDGTLYSEENKLTTILLNNTVKILKESSFIEAYTNLNNYQIIKSYRQKYQTETTIEALVKEGIYSYNQLVERICVNLPDDYLTERDEYWKEVDKINIPIVIVTDNLSEFAEYVASKIGLKPLVVFGVRELGYKSKVSPQGSRFLTNKIYQMGYKKPLLIDNDSEIVDRALLNTDWNVLHIEWVPGEHLPLLHERRRN